MPVDIADLEELMESIDIARIRALALRDVPGGGAAAKAINALADSVEGLAHIALLDRRHGPRDRREFPMYQHSSKGRRRDDR